MHEPCRSLQLKHSAIGEFSRAACAGLVGRLLDCSPTEADLDTFTHDWQARGALPCFKNCNECHGCAQAASCPCCPAPTHTHLELSFPGRRGFSLSLSRRPWKSPRSGSPRSARAASTAAAASRRSATSFSRPAEPRCVLRCDRRTQSEGVGWATSCSSAALFAFWSLCPGYR